MATGVGRPRFKAGLDPRPAVANDWAFGGSKNPLQAVRCEKEERGENVERLYDGWRQMLFFHCSFQVLSILNVMHFPLQLFPSVLASARDTAGEKLSERTQPFFTHLVPLDAHPGANVGARRALDPLNSIVAHFRHPIPFSSAKRLLPTNDGSQHQGQSDPIILTTGNNGL